MESFIFSINVVMPLVLLMCLGVFLKKCKVFDDSFLKTANKLVFKVFMPVLLFYNIYSSDFREGFNLKLVLLSAFIVIGSFLLMFYLVPKFENNNKNKGVLIQAMFRSNFVLFGIPVCTNMFGEASIGVTSMLIAIVVPLYNFLSVFVLAYYSDDKFNIYDTLISIVKNPLIIASMLGILASVWGVNLPIAVEKTVSDVSKLATPLALIMLGGDFKFGSIYKNLKYIIIVCFEKLICLPSVGILLAVILGFRNVELGVILAMTASPIAVSSYIMAIQSEANGELAGLLVAFTTMLSAITIFIFVFILRSLGLI